MDWWRPIEALRIDDTFNADLTGCSEKNESSDKLDVRSIVAPAEAKT